MLYIIRFEKNVPTIEALINNELRIYPVRMPLDSSL